jgi:hypothetical protein
MDLGLFGSNTKQRKCDEEVSVNTDIKVMDIF